MAELTSEEVNNLTSSLKDLTKLLQKNNKEVFKAEDSLENINSGLGNAKKSLDKIAKDPMNKLTSSVKELAKDVSSVFNVTFFGSVTAFAANLIKDAIKLDTVANQVATRMAWGEGGVKRFKGAVNELQSSFGTTYENASNLVRELSERHYVDNVTETAASIDLMSRATGESASNLVQFSDHLSKAAGMSSKAITATMASMTKAQQAVGLSNAGMSAVVDRVSQAAEKMAAFGKTEAEIKKMAASTVLLASSMEKVGVSAGRAAEIVEQLTDPDRIEDNIMLYSQLGISMEDALSGNVDISQDQLKELGQKIADMGPIAGKQLAQTMGMSYTEAVKMSKLEAPEIGVDQVEVAEDGALAALDDMTKKTEGIEKKFERFWNKLEGKVRKLGPVIIGLAGIFLPKLFQMAAKGLTTFLSKSKQDIQASINTEAIGSAIGAKFEKAADKAKTLAVTGAKNFSEAFHSTMIKLDPFAGFNDKTRVMFEDAAKSIGEGWFDRFMNSGIDKLADTYQEQMNGIMAQNEELMKQLDDLGIKYNIVNDRIVALEGQDLTTAQEKFLKYATVANETNLRTIEKLAKKKAEALGLGERETQILQEQNKYTATRKNMLEQAEAIETNVGNLKKEQVSAMAEQQRLLDLAEKATGAEQDALFAAAEEQEQIAIQKAKEVALAAQELIYQKDLAIAQEEMMKAAQMAAGEARDAAMKAAEAKIQAAEDDNKAVMEEINSAKTMSDAYAKQVEYANKIKDTVEEISNTKPANIIPEEELEKARNAKGVFGKLFTGIGDRIKAGIAGSIGAKWTEAVDNLNKQRAAAGKGEVHGVKAGGIMAAKGLGKMVGGILKSIGPMAIVMSIVGKFIDKFKDKFENIIDNLMESLQPVMDIIMPVVSDLMNVLVKSLMPPILNILSMGLKVLNFILKPIIAILRLCEHIPGIGGALKGTADALEAATGPKVQEALVKAASDIGSSTKDFTNAVEEEKESAEEAKAAQIKVEGGQAVVASKSSGTAVSSQASSTTQTVTEKKTADDDAKEAEDQKKNKEEKQLRNFLMGNGTKDLPTYFAELLGRFDKLISSMEKTPSLVSNTKLGSVGKDLADSTGSEG